jgi:thioredoxin 1
VASAAKDPALAARARSALASLGRYEQTRGYQGQGNTFAAGGGGGSPQVIDFYTTWCGPCKRLAPILAEIESSMGSRVSFKRLDCEAPENEATVQKFNIDAYPTVVFLDRSGREVKRMVGLYDKNAYVAQIEKLIAR